MTPSCGPTVFWKLSDRPPTPDETGVLVEDIYPLSQSLQVYSFFHPLSEERLIQVSPQSPRRMLPALAFSIQTILRHQLPRTFFSRMYNQVNWAGGLMEFHYIDVSEDYF
jgi:hypothetical protein